MFRKFRKKRNLLGQKMILNIASRVKKVIVAYSIYVKKICRECIEAVSISSSSSSSLSFNLVVGSEGGIPETGIGDVLPPL